MTQPDLLLTGAGGFIGGAIRHELTQRAQAHRLRALVHRRTPQPEPGAAGPHYWTGDLTRPSSMTGLCDGVTTLIHAASHIGSDPATCEAVNHHGTAHLLAEAQRAGVRHILYISTAAVYGNGPHRGITEDEIPPAPVSPTSRSRLRAEAAVRAAGGIVLRPMFVTGAGDRWFIPTLLRMTQQLGAWVDHGQARLSTIPDHQLATAVCDLVLEHDLTAKAGTLYHCTDSEPLRVRTMIERAAPHRDMPLPQRSLSMTEALRHDLDGVSPRQVTLFSQDHWYDSTKLTTALHRPVAGAPAGSPRQQT